MSSTLFTLELSLLPHPHLTPPSPTPVATPPTPSERVIHSQHLTCEPQDVSYPVRVCTAYSTAYGMLHVVGNSSTAHARLLELKVRKPSLRKR